MSNLLKIRCKDLGVDHDTFVSGTSLSDLIECVTKALENEGVIANSPSSAQLIHDTARSTLLQASRPASKRSVRLSELIAALAPSMPQVRSDSWKVTA